MSCGKMRKTWRQVKGPGADQHGHDLAPSNGECGAGLMMCACSACAGEYEDPDRTAWTPAEADEAEREDPLDGEREEFPAEE